MTGTWAVLVPLMALWIALGRRRADNGGTLTFAQGFGTGFVVSLVRAVTSGALFVIYTAVLNPGWRECSGVYRDGLKRRECERILRQRGRRPRGSRHTRPFADA